MRPYRTKQDGVEIRPLLGIGLAVICTFIALLMLEQPPVPQRLPTVHAESIHASTAKSAEDGDVFLPFIAWGLATSHYGRFSSYEGSKTCVECHADQVQEVHNSVHYQWFGDTPYVTNMESGGKLGGINDFCGYPDVNFIGQLTNLDNEVVDGGCATCHVGLGLKPEVASTEAQLENIDCLVCHSDSYERKVEAVDGQLRFVPAPEKMAVGLLKAITDIGPPSDASCLACHAYAGGGQNNKRGDIDIAHANVPTAAFDVHMASTELGGAGLQCIDCHTVENHQIAGRGMDLRPTDLDQTVACTNCHAEEPHDERELDKHTARVACETCHIPTFADLTPTEMVRDYRSVEVNEMKRLYEPLMTLEAQVVPEYMFSNGTSRFYQFGEAAIPSATNRVVMATPLGDIHDANAAIYPVKHHVAIQPVDNATEYLIPVKLGTLFQTGNVDDAIRQGAEAVGWSLDQGYSFVETERFMGIYHEVAPKSQALQCGDCHDSENRLDFDALGYTPKETHNSKPLCASCHRDESGEWDAEEFFEKVHEKHVDDKGYTCAECHTFSAAR